MKKNKQSAQSSNVSSKSASQNINQIYEGSQQSSSQPNQSIIESQHFSSQYAAVVRRFAQMKQQQLIRKLKSHEIEWRRDNCSNIFSKKCTKTDWQSAQYLAFYGHLQMKIKTIRVNIQPTAFGLMSVGSGEYGNIFSLQLNEGTYALKNIKIDDQIQQHIDGALKEFFMAKVASALQVGPKCYPIFGYDVVVYKKSLQFASQMCRTQYTEIQIKQQLRQNDLLQSLQILHSLNFCHQDIKNQNIAWSQYFQKFVFLDFGFSEILKEKIGYKTNTYFVGTLAYCSAEMKKLYFLRSKNFVDLYYNDLHCLRKTWEEMRNQSSLKKQHNRSYKKEQKKKERKSKHQISYSKNQGSIMKVYTEQCISLVSYFKLKRALYESRFQEVGQIIKKQHYLHKSMKNIVTQFLQHNKQLKSIEIFSEICQIININNTDQLRLSSKIDKIMFEYEMKNYNKFAEKFTIQKLLDAIQSHQSFQQIWKKQKWMSKIFYTIDVYSTPRKKIGSSRNKIINRIFQEINKNKFIGRSSNLLKYRAVLIQFFEYFKIYKNVEILIKIQTYFVLFDDFYNRDRMQQQILAIYEQNLLNNKQKYLNLNFEFFFGNSLTRARLSFLNSDIHILNLKKLKNILSQQGNQRDYKFEIDLTKTIQLMIGINMYYKVFWEGIDLILVQLAKDYIQRVGNHVTEEMKQFVCQIILSDRHKQDKQKKINPFKWSQIKNHFLQKCFFRKLVINWFATRKIPIAQKLLKEQQFTIQFLTIHHANIQNAQQAYISSSEKIIQIGLDYLQIVQEHSFHVSTSSLLKLHAIIQKQKVESYLQQYFSNLKIQKIKSIQDIEDFNASILLVVVFFIRLRRQLKIENVRKAIKPMSQSILFYIQVVQNIPQLQHPQKQEPQDMLLRILPPQSFSNYYRKKTMIQLLKIIKLTILLINLKFEEAIQIIVKLEKQEVYCTNLLLINVLCCFYPYFEPQKQELFERCIFTRIFKIDQYDKFYSAITYDELGYIVVKAYSRKKQFNLAREFIYDFFNFLENYKIDVSQTNLIGISQYFVKQICPLENVESIVTDLCKKQLKWFDKCQKYTQFLVACYRFLVFKKSDVMQNLRKRAFKICLFYSKAFTEGFFQQHKIYLMEQSAKIFSKKRKVILTKKKRFGIKISNFQRLIQQIYLKISFIDNQKQRQIYQRISSILKEKLINYSFNFPKNF